MILGALLTLCLIAGPASAQDAERWDARVTAVTGEATIRPPGGEENVAATEGMPLEEGDAVVTGAGSSAEIALDGGSLITLDANSTFVLEKTEKADSVFSLSFGSLLAKIQSLGERHLSVRTPTTVAAVRGTEFGVEATGEGESHVGVFDEGRVEVTGAGTTEVLNANQETSVARGSAPMKAFALKRFAARRRAMRAQLKRLKGVSKRWKSLSGAKRREMRQKLFQKRGERGMRGQRRHPGGRR